MLGVDIVDDKRADELLGPKKAKGGKDKGKDKGPSKSDSDYKAEDEEELPSWQDQPAIPELHAADISSSSTVR